MDALLLKKSKLPLNSSKVIAKDPLLNLTKANEKISELSLENEELKKQLSALQSKVDSLYLDRVSTEDFQQICVLNQQLRDDLSLKDGLLEECEKFISDMLKK
ncbi:hypothetical protein BB560_000359 [Smittium megazygosporum]|uniref:Uncharacterized protein n=1 Tax=Smittium megazygosporum TaxID=133381 RepID=A0A2T9ZKK2_9FUNG|nr:hypothetical protein BB560_000359 [Smittium megazygosporum]